MIDENQIKHDGNTIRVKINELVAKKNHNCYIFLTEVFESKDSDLHGAKYMEVIPVTEEALDQRLEEFRDYEWSGLAHIYDEIETEESWDSWIDQQIRLEGYDLVADLKFGKFEELTLEKYEEEEGIECDYVEWVAGGRMSRTLENGADIIYDQELWALAQEAEENGLENLL